MIYFRTIIAVTVALWVTMATGHAVTSLPTDPPLVLKSPEGYCTLTDESPREASYLSMLQRANAGNNTVLMAFADCNELAAYRTGTRKGLQHYGQYLGTMTNGAMTKVPPGSRDSVLTAMEKALPKLDITKLAAEPSGKSSAVAVTTQQGVVDRDDVAVYLVTLAQRPTGDNSKVDSAMIAGLTAITVVKNTLVSINLYRPYAGPPSFAALSTELRPLVRVALAANGTDIEMPASLGGNGGGGVSLYIIVALVATSGAALVGLGLVLYRRRPKE